MRLSNRATSPSWASCPERSTRCTSRTSSSSMRGLEWGIMRPPRAGGMPAAPTRERPGASIPRASEERKRGRAENEMRPCSGSSSSVLLFRSSSLPDFPFANRGRTSGHVRTIYILTNKRRGTNPSAYCTRPWMPRKTAVEVATSTIVRPSMLVFITCDR